MTEEAPRRYRLVGYHDLREWDEVFEGRVPLVPGTGNFCDRCGLEHAKVYEVEDREKGAVFAVGSTCVKRIFAGIDPEGKELRRARKEYRDQRDEALEALHEEAVLEVAGRVLARLPEVLPEFRVEETARLVGPEKGVPFPVMVVELAGVRGAAWMTGAPANEEAERERERCAFGDALGKLVGEEWAKVEFPEVVREYKVRGRAFEVICERHAATRWVLMP